MPPPPNAAHAPRWRLLDTPPAPGAWNMAVDEALAETVRRGGVPVLRLYRWRPACLSLGRHQPARGRYDTAALAARGIEVVRRPTGGRAVLHHRELTYSVAAPGALLGELRTAYATINRALVAGLRRLGVDAGLQGVTGASAPKPSLTPCFDLPVEGEVVAQGRKLVGSAQQRSGGVLLQHGSLLLEDDQSAVPGLLLAGGTVAPAPASLAALLGRVPGWEELAGALAAGWEEALGVELRREALTADEEERAAALAERYAAPAWTWHL
ncbi:MAG TPA: lipoate--protein ligase family protein [Longimicrobiaceae bacterium]|nr:lipoate--protein ligase family protein [Longimicrobiaceae bacterium]